ncbi:MAG: porphobilinogen synthase [Candidatus Limnocylindria bacterium]
MGQGTVARRPLAEHPGWARALRGDGLASRMIIPVVVSASVEDRERVEGTGQLERLSLTELVRDARAAASAGFAGLLLFGATDRKDARAFIASERDHIVPRAIRAVKEAVPELGVATDVCVCAYTDHGQCVLFRDGGADVTGTLERLGEIAVAHADAGADLVIPSGMLDGTVAAVRRALAGDHDDVPVAAMAKLESSLYSLHRLLVQSAPIRERAVPLLAADDPTASRARVLRDLAEGADAVVVKPGTPAIDIVAGLRPLVRLPLISFHTADEHAPFVAASEDLDGAAAERETLAASRRAGADLVVSYGAWSAAE